MLAEFGTGQVLWSMLWFFLFFVWIWILISVFADIFRSSDLSGWGKALWSIFVVFMPYLGVFVYLIARGGKMHERSMKQAVQAQQQFDEYVRSVASTSGSGDGMSAELERLVSLRDKGAITADDYEKAKAKLLA